MTFKFRQSVTGSFLTVSFFSFPPCNITTDQIISHRRMALAAHRSWIFFMNIIHFPADAAHNHIAVWQMQACHDSDRTFTSTATFFL
jgi:hypothetical protein